MIAAAVQRWRDQRDSYRPAGEPIATRLYEAELIEGAGSDRIARAFVEQHHYSASYPAARVRCGLYRAGELVGVAVFSQPTRNDVLSIFPGEAGQSCELGRFVLLDDVPANGETWFLARCFEQLRRVDMLGVLSFSDPMRRVTAVGLEVFGGHIGTIYQAHNAHYLGRAARRTLHMLPDGSVFSARAMSKIRARERGWRYAAGLLEAHGADRLGELDDSAAWLRLWLPRLTRTVRHPGNHRYAWTLQKRDRRHLPASLPYPKLSIARAA